MKLAKKLLSNIFYLDIEFPIASIGVIVIDDDCPYEMVVVTTLALEFEAGAGMITYRLNAD